MSCANSLPPVIPETALFPDVDGTLLELASQPDQVRATPPLNVSLASATAQVGGALAPVSGRSIESPDQIFSPRVMPAAALVLRYRGAPEQHDAAREAVGRARSAADDDFHVQMGKMVSGLKPAGRNQGTAVMDFMAEPSCAGRRPIFVDDDVTDENGFRALKETGGHSVRVGPVENSAARFQADGGEQFISWLDAAWETKHGSDD